MSLFNRNSLGMVAMGMLLLTIPDAAQAREDEYCREYTKRVVIGGQTEESYGTACLRPDGQWEIQKDPTPVRYNAPRINAVPPPVTYVIHDAPRPRYVPYWSAAYPSARYHRHGRWHGHDDHHRGRHR